VSNSQWLYVAHTILAARFSTKCNPIPHAQTPAGAARPTSNSLAHHRRSEYLHAIQVSAPIERRSQSGVSKLVIIILVCIGAIIVLGLLGIYLFAPRLDVTRKRVNESAAMADIRNIGINQLNYYSSFDDAGYARDLASLGPGADGKCAQGPSSAHACMISTTLGNSACTGTSWCAQGGYKFIIQGICVNGKCTDYVISATPVDALNGSRNFCSTSDNAIRFETAAPRAAPFSMKECQALPSLQ
jgi:hypothetical protein